MSGISRLKRLRDGSNVVVDHLKARVRSLAPSFTTTFRRFNIARKPTLFIRADQAVFDDVPMLAFYRGHGFHHVVVYREDASVTLGAGPGQIEGLDIRVLDPATGNVRIGLAALLQQRLRDTWCLFADQGSYLAFPFCERRTILDLCQFLFDERRRSFFTIRLDVYRDPEGGGSLSYMPGEEGWRFDRLAFQVREDPTLATHIWEGGFMRRFKGSATVKVDPYDILSRISLMRPDQLMAPSQATGFLQPRRHNRPISENHLSPTGCMFSDRSYQRWLGWYHTLAERDRQVARAQLMSAPFLPVVHAGAPLMAAGLLNQGQWF